MPFLPGNNAQRAPLAQLITSILRRRPPLKHLNLSNCGLQAKEGTLILSALAKAEIATLESIDLRGNPDWNLSQQCSEQLAAITKRQISLQLYADGR